jgi:hypothetical protein
MLSFVIILLFLVSQLARIFFPEHLNTNLVLYLMIFTLVLQVMHLTKESFNLGWCKPSDETKLELLVAIKSFLLVFILL